MNDDQLNGLLFMVMLILPISALAARRLPLGTTVKMALAWIAIFGGLFVLVALWQWATGTGSLLRALFP